MIDEYKVFASNLNKFLDSFGMTRIELAEKLEVGTTTVHYWCNGEKLPRLKKIDEMCKIFHCRRSDLLEREMTKEYIVRAEKSAHLYELIEGLGDKGMDRLIAYAEELRELYGTTKDIG